MGHHRPGGFFFFQPLLLVSGRARTKQIADVAHRMGAEDKSLGAGALFPSPKYYLGTHKEERSCQPPPVLFETLLAPRLFPQKNAISSNANAAAGICVAQLSFFFIYLIREKNPVLIVFDCVSLLFFPSRAGCIFKLIRCV